MWYIIAAKGRFVLMVKCRASPTSLHHFKVHCSLNVFFVIFLPIELIFWPVDASFQLFLHTWMLITTLFKHFSLKLLPPFSPIFAQMQPSNVHSWSLYFCYSQSKVFHLTFYRGICWELQAMTRSDASQE